ncbi:hypothetical protein [Rathayibacter sp. VKM Ac-2630]|uniref:hypothetical protein n=1 Tax=Rathayibacter sp. VKM Ac-2630 TaxID=1938617 RepID=UPI0009812495|nr:hypothetical protein [Rathayibacter sp. VKM Ac-2630]OOB90726.1 hypothetical protein B0T42_09975 [Rathayibacter sp. VKM Ac-2630]
MRDTFAPAALSDLERELHDDPVGPRCIRQHDAKGRPGKLAAARAGQLCWSCYGRLSRDVVTLAELVTTITEQTAPSIVSPITERVAGTKAPRLPIDADGIDALNELWPLLARWVAAWTVELRLDPPTVLSESIERDRDVDRVPAGWSTRTLTRAANDAAEWLVLAAPAWCTSVHVAHFYAEVSEAARVYSGRWRLAERGPRRSSRKCGRGGIGCGAGQVVVGWDGDDPYAVCNACGWRPDDEAQFAAAAATEGVAS